MDPLIGKPLKNKPPGQDLCNPLYWYPRTIPEHCYFKDKLKPDGSNPMSKPLPVPVPMPPQLFPIPMPPMYPLVPTSYPKPPDFPMPMPPPMPLPFGVPLAPTNPMLPTAGVPAYSYPTLFPLYREKQQAGMVPGIPGLVTHDGGINIMPFSDAYADMFEEYKQRIIRKKIQKVLDDYDDNHRRWRHPRRRHY